LITNSSIQCLTVAQIDPAPEPADREWQTLYPVMKREEEVINCVPFGRIVFEPESDRHSYQYRLRNFEPKEIDFLPGRFGPSPHNYSWELVKPRRNAIQPGQVFHRFEDCSLADGQLNDRIPIHVFYKATRVFSKDNGRVLRLHAVSIPFLWLMDRLSEDPPNSVLESRASRRRRLK